MEHEIDLLIGEHSIAVNRPIWCYVFLRGNWIVPIHSGMPIRIAMRLIHTVVAAAIMMIVLRAYLVVTGHRGPGPSSSTKLTTGVVACPVDRQLPGGLCACASETNWSGEACILIPPNVRRRIGTVMLGRERHSDNCVLWARERVRTLPYGLGTWSGKLAAVNSHEPRPGSVAMVKISNGKYRDIGHVAIIESVSGSSITILEANWYHGRVSRRTATGYTLAEAAEMLQIQGYYRP